MPTTLIRYPLDRTGTNPNNLVQNELHTLAQKRFRAVAPMYGAFFTDGFTVFDKATNRQLIRGTEYVFVELYQSLTMLTGREVAGAMIVINPDVSSTVAINYQCVGGEYSENTETLVALLNQSSDDTVSKSFLDVENKPATFVPSLHLHDLGDGIGFEVLVFALEKLRNAITWADAPKISNMLNKIDFFLSVLDSRINSRVDSELLASIIKFKSLFTKELAGLGLVQNLAISTEAEGRLVADPDYVMKSMSDNKYAVTQTLIGFKEELYNQLVSSKTTNLGKPHGMIGNSLKSVLRSLPNGGRVILDTFETVKLQGLPLDMEVYPDTGQIKDKWIIVKVTNNLNNQGGVLLGINMTNGDTYRGIMTMLTGGNSSIAWKRFISEIDINDFIAKFTAHLKDEANPHKDKKHHVGLGDVENLPIATKEDIICRKPTRKYITYDGLLLFMKAFMTGVKSVDEITEDDTTPSAVARYQMIFAPCGPCGTNANFSNVPTPSPPPPSIKPRGERLTTYCIGVKQMGKFSDGFGGTYEQVIDAQSASCGFKGKTSYPPRGSLLDRYCDGTTRMGKYADGNGGFYNAIIEEKSVQCGYIRTYKPTFLISDAEENPIGLGFGPNDIVDPLAIVLLTDAMGNELCYIYPDSTAEHPIAISDIHNSLIGYAYPVTLL